MKVFFQSPPEPMVQIRKNALIFYDQYQRAGRKKTEGLKRFKSNTTQPTITTKSTVPGHETKTTYSGSVCLGTSKRIKRTVDILCQLSPPKWAVNPVHGYRFKHSLSFITVTIPGEERRVTPKEGNKILLAPFIRQLRKKHCLRTYIWKAEFQKNGQLHYHITTPSIIHYQYIQDNWNNLLSQEGLLKEWSKIHTDRWPPSTQTRSVYKNKDLEWYLAKEISKSIQNNKTEGKLWDCSKNIRGIKFFSLGTPSYLMENLNQKRMINCEHCNIYRQTEAYKILSKPLQAKYLNYLASIITAPLY